MLKKHLFLIAFALLGCFFGFLGFLIGLGCGFFLDLIFARLKDEFVLRNFDKKSSKKTAAFQEPFPACIYLCALVTACVSQSSVAASILHGNFSDLCKNLSLADWQRFCQNACASEQVNVDLMTESLALQIKKAKTLPPLDRFFRVLITAEVFWKDERGTKPSIYLAELLGYTLKQIQMAEEEALCAAYQCLGLKRGADFAEVKKAHRVLAAKFHPDSGGNQEKFLEVQNSFDLIKKLQEQEPRQ